MQKREKKGFNNLSDKIHTSYKLQLYLPINKQEIKLLHIEKEEKKYKYKISKKTKRKIHQYLIIYQ